MVMRKPSRSGQAGVAPILRGGGDYGVERIAAERAVLSSIGRVIASFLSRIGYFLSKHKAELAFKNSDGLLVMKEANRNDYLALRLRVGARVCITAA
ncbi:hypothetical protein [Ramlibacter sp.]|uniref:hypothetical protein n=1 Tax=Ramlibacter sp. TaxID=1917967 RepID=UPI002FCC7313